MESTERDEAEVDRPCVTPCVAMLGSALGLVALFVNSDIFWRVLAALHVSGNLFWNYSVFIVCEMA